MDKRDLEVIKHALKNKHRDEPFERALGRAIRKDRGDFKRYLRIITEVREFARNKKVDVVEGAQILTEA